MTMLSRSTKPRRAPYRRPRSGHQAGVEALEERLALSIDTAVDTAPAFTFQHPAAVGEMHPGTMVPAAAVAENNGGALIFSPNSKVYGKTMAEWTSTYLRWLYSTDQSNNKVGQVQFVPIPTGDLISGTGTPTDPFVLQGKLNITLSPGTSFVLPLGLWLGETYTNGSTDPVIPDEVFLASKVDNAGNATEGVQPKLTIDGKEVLSNVNKARYYIPPTKLDPIIPYQEPAANGAVGLAFFQGYVIMGAPLTPGVHKIELYEPYIIPAGVYSGLPDGLGVIYDNTWTVTVSR